MARKAQTKPAVKISAEVKKNSEERKTDDESLFHWVDERVSEASEYTTVWSENQEKFFKLRMMIKKVKTFPFVGCSNIRMPTAEIKIRKVKAALTNVITGIRPIVQAIPSPSGNMQTAQKIEKFLDFLIMDKINIMPKVVIGIDQELEKGFYLYKPYWRVDLMTRYETYSLEDLSMEEATQLYDMNTTPEQIAQALIERMEVDMSDMVAEDNKQAIDKAVEEILAGKDQIKVKLKDVTYNAPDVALCDPERVFVNTDSGYHPQDCQMLTHEFFLPLHTVKDNVEFKGWSSSAVEEIEGYQIGGIRFADKKRMEAFESTLTDTQKDLQEGIERLNNPSNFVRIWETYCWKDINGDGVDEKAVITSAPDFSLVLRKITLPFDNGKFPFVKIFYELRDNRWFAHRGIPQILEDIIKEIDTQHMQKIDQQTIRNAPMFMYRAGMVNPNLVQFIPAQGIPVNGMNPLRDTLDVVNNNNPNVEYSYEREQMLLETKVEELIGQIDFTLQSMINKRQPRTLGEVQLQQQNMQMVFSLDSSLHIMCFTELINMIWDLWCQYGDDETEFSYFGKNGWEKIRLTREEVQGKYKITLRGNDQNTNPQVEQMKAQQIMMAATNPAFLQMGVITQREAANSLRLFYQTLDIPNWEELVNMQVKPPAPPPPPPPAVLIKPTFADLTDMEQAQVIASAGVKPDIAGRSLKSRAIVQEKQHEQQMERGQQGIEFGRLLNEASPEEPAEEEPAESSAE